MIDKTDSAKNQRGMIIFTFCFNPQTQDLTFAGNVSIIEAEKVLHDKIFSSLIMANDKEDKTDKKIEK